MRRLSLLALPALLTLLACPLPPISVDPPADAGDIGDGGPAPDDAGGDPPGDGGTPPDDGGGDPPGDGGTPPADAGFDAGVTPPADGGYDAGPQAVDGGPTDPPVSNGSWSYVHEPIGAASPYNFTTDFTIQDNVGDEVIVVAVVTSPYAPTLNGTGVSGFATAWSKQDVQCASRQTPPSGVELWTVVGPSGNGAISVSLNYPPDAVAVAAVRYTNVADVNPIGVSSSSNTTGVNGGCISSNTSLDSATYSVPLSQAGYGTRVVSAVSFLSGQHSAGGGFTEILETGIGSATVALQDGVVVTAPFSIGGSFATVADWSAAALELRGP